MSMPVAKNECDKCTAAGWDLSIDMNWQCTHGLGILVA